MSYDTAEWLREVETDAKAVREYLDHYRSKGGSKFLSIAKIHQGIAEDPGISGISRERISAALVILGRRREVVALKDRIGWTFYAFAPRSGRATEPRGPRS